MIKSVTDCSETFTLSDFVDLVLCVCPASRWYIVINSPIRLTWLGEHQFSNGKMDSRLAKTQQMCILLPASWWTHCLEGSDSGSPASTFFEDTKNVVTYQLAPPFFQLRFHLRFLLSFLAAKLFSWTCEIIPRWNEERYLHRSTCSVLNGKDKRHLNRGVRPPGPFEQWGQRLLAPSLEDRIQFKSQQSLKSFACS